jgi:hypothetical protein
MQRQELNLKGARGSDGQLVDLSIPDKYRWVPPGMSAESPYNVAQLYRKFGEAISDGAAFSPGFDSAITRHRLLGAIERASDTGEKQVIRTA